MIQARRSRVALVGVVLVLGVLILPPVRGWIGDRAVAVLGPGVLPETIDVCGRDYNTGGEAMSEASVLADFGTVPQLVSAWGATPCPAEGWCAGGSMPCQTVVAVRVGEDGYVIYGLVGGP
jgi:hypothetical protein